MASIKRRTTAKGEIRYDVRVRVGARVVTKTFSRRQDADRWARAMETDVVLRIGDRPARGQRVALGICRPLADDKDV